MKTANILVDKLGRTVTVGDRIAYASYKNLGMTLGTIVKLGTLRAVVAPDLPAFNDATESFRTTELIKL